MTDLMSRFAEQSARLVRAEVELARLEATQRAKRLGFGAGACGASGLFAFFAACCGITAAILALAMEIRPWAAALAVLFACLIVAGVLGLAGLISVRRGLPPVPPDTADNVRADVTAVRQGIKHHD